MKLFKNNPQKTKAQAMVEFAIVLPLLLLLLYGLLEAGRLLFIYSTIVTASRQAVRYGSATGQGISSAVPRYRDCNGIRNAAQKVDFLNAFDDTRITIQHDNGPTDPNGPVTYCAGAVDTTNYTPTNSSRLLVTIDGDYLPIVPKLIPFVKRSVATSNPIRAKSARTILVSVSIVVTVPPSTYLPSTPTATATINTPTFTPSSTPTATITNTPILSPTASLIPSPTRTGTITIVPTFTSSPTITLTPSITPTVVTGCNLVTPANISISGNTMTMTITNPNSYTINASDVFVTWNSDKGHQTGGDKTLKLLSASMQPGAVGPATPVPPTVFWTGSSSGPSATLTNPNVFISIAPNTTTTITFTFDKTYDNPDPDYREEILMNLNTNGCQLFPIHKSYQ